MQINGTRTTFGAQSLVWFCETQLCMYASGTPALVPQKPPQRLPRPALPHGNAASARAQGVEGAGVIPRGTVCAGAVSEGVGPGGGAGCLPAGKALRAARRRRGGQARPGVSRAVRGRENGRARWPRPPPQSCSALFPSPPRTTKQPHFQNTALKVASVTHRECRCRRRF